MTNSQRRSSGSEINLFLMLVNTVKCIFLSHMLCLKLHNIIYVDFVDAEIFFLLILAI
jgi:hypothetical protein